MQEYLAQSGLSYALLRPCNFYENMINFTFFQPQADGSYAFCDNMGTAPHAWHSVSTIGLTAAGELYHLYNTSDLMPCKCSVSTHESNLQPRRPGDYVRYTCMPKLIKCQ